MFQRLVLYCVSQLAEDPPSSLRTIQSGVWLVALTDGASIQVYYVSDDLCPGIRSKVAVA